MTPRKSKAQARKPSTRGEAETMHAVEDVRVVGLLRALKADPQLAPVVQEFEARATGKVNGKLFALFTQGTLVVKLPKERVGDLIASNAGQAFDPGHGRRMKEWLTVTDPSASWVDLTKEAYDFVKPPHG